MESEHHLGTAVILMYHRIAKGGSELCVPPAQFRHHLAMLRQEGYQVLPLRELARAIGQGEVPDKAIAITLDDGYLDALTHAAPALQEFQVPATFFVVTSTLDGPTEFWWETLERIFAHEALPPVLDTALPDGVSPMPTTTPQERLAACDVVRCDFYPLTLAQRRERIAALLRWSGLPSSADSLDARAMTPEEVRILSQLPGVEIGSHSENHLLLPAQPTATKKSEIFLGKQRLEALLGQEIHSFSYPHGAFDEESVELAGQAGFALAVTTGNQQATLQSRSLVLPRYGVSAKEDLSQRLKTLFAAQPQEQHRSTHA